MEAEAAVHGLAAEVEEAAHWIAQERCIDKPLASCRSVAFGLPKKQVMGDETLVATARKACFDFPLKAPGEIPTVVTMEDFFPSAALMVAPRGARHVGLRWTHLLICVCSWLAVLPRRRCNTFHRYARLPRRRDWMHLACAE